MLPDQMQSALKSSGEDVLEQLKLMSWVGVSGHNLAVIIVGSWGSCLCLLLCLKAWGSSLVKETEAACALPTFLSSQVPLLLVRGLSLIRQGDLGDSLSPKPLEQA